MRGYKVFNPDWTCRGFKFEVGKTFKEDVKPVCCDRGFHFCINIVDCFSYYKFDPNNKVAEVEALGDIDNNEEDSKCCTNQIRIVKEINWYEVLELVNTGNYNTGYCNTGNKNSGNYNTGNSNSGDSNSGNCNTGNSNSGNENSGNFNTGNCNSGNYNKGSSNTGYFNTGNENSGDYNSGNKNSGDYNIGNSNTGCCNTGDYNCENYNTGDCNTGDCNTGNNNCGDCNTGNNNCGNYNTGNNNTGDSNSGDYNRGDWNCGDWNTTCFSNGCFNTKAPRIYLFNKPSKWTFENWLDSNAHYILMDCPSNTSTWIDKERMTVKEKAENPEYKVTGGFLKIIEREEERQMWWDRLPAEDKKTVMNIPNFDKNIFKEITGINIKE